MDEVYVVYMVSVSSFYSKPQGLLEGDSEMEDGEIESKVSVSVVSCVCVLCRLLWRIV